MHAYRALAFDLDGTVVDSHAFTFDAVRAVCAAWGRQPTDAEIHAAFGPPEAIVLDRLLGPGRGHAAMPRLLQAYRDRRDRLRLDPHLRRLLEACRGRGWRLALFTGRGEAGTQLVLETVGLLDMFETWITGDRAAPKPSGAGLRDLLRSWGLEPHELLVVGDSPLDLAAAGAAGVDAGLAAWYADAVTRVPPPAGRPVFETFDDLAVYLGLDPSAPATSG